MTSIGLRPWIAVLCAVVGARAAEVEPASAMHEPIQGLEQPLGDIGDWYILDIIETRSAGGATFTKLPDGSIQVSGESAVQDSYTIIARTMLEDITAVRLDALADESLPNDGPGRARNGNFTITEIELAATPLDTPAQSSAVSFGSVEADYSQREYDAAFAVDGDRATGWSIGTGGEDHRLVLRTDSPVGQGKVTLLTFTVHQDHPDRKHYTLGRFRLSATTAQQPPPASDEPQFQPLLVGIGFAPVKIAAFEATSGAAMTPHADGDDSILITGDQAINDSYFIEVRSELERISGMRIEALPDGTLPQGGPGRTSRNFAVSEIAVLAAPASGPDELKPVALRLPSATHAQRNLTVERAIDGNEKTFWAVSERDGPPTAAAFVFESPVAHEGGTILRLSMVQRLAIGRLRLSLTAARQEHYITVRPPTEQAAAPPMGAAGAARPPVERFYNAGGWLYADPRGHQWLPTRTFRDGADGYLGGSPISSDVPLNPLLHRAISGIDQFRATVPEGRYRVALLFAEPRQETQPGYRRFDVFIEGVKVITGLDPVRVAGGVGRPYVHVEPAVPVKDGVLDVEFFGDRPLLSAISVIEVED